MGVAGDMLNKERIQCKLVAVELCSSSTGQVSQTVVITITIRIFSPKMLYQSDLMKAVSEGDENELRMLLDCHIDVNEQNDWGFTALHSAAKKGDYRMVQCLISYGADINITNDYGFNALGSATMNGHLLVVRELLKCRNVNINHANNYRYTPIISAAREGYSEIVKELLEYMKKHGISKEILFSTNKCGNTALHEAALRGHYEVVKLLIKYGGNNDMSNIYDQTPLSIAKDEFIFELILFESDRCFI